MRKEIMSKMGYLRQYAGILKKMQKHSRSELEKDMMLRGVAERYMQLSLEVVIEISEMIIAREGYRKPESHKEAIRLLGEHDIIPKKFAVKFAPAAGFRNILVHGYAEIDVGKLHAHLQNDIKDFDVFARHVVKYLKKRE